MGSLLEPQDIWEALLIGGRKAGFARRRIRRAAGPAGDVVEIELTMAFRADEDLVRLHHVFDFRDAPGFPWRSYRFDLPDGSAVAIRLEGGQVVGEVAGTPVEMPVPPGTVPTYGLYPHLLTLPFERGFELRLPALEDATCDLLPEVRLVSVGWENVALLGRHARLWRIDEVGAAEEENHYWLDEERRLMKADRQGAESYRVPGREAALARLAPEVAVLAGE